MIDKGIEYYGKALDFCLRHHADHDRCRLWPAGRGPRDLLADPAPRVLPRGRCRGVRDVRPGPSGLRIEETEKRIKAVEDFVRKMIAEEDLQLVLSEIGVTSDWSAAYTLNAGPMDAVVKISLNEERTNRPRNMSHFLRTAFRTMTVSTTWSSPSTPAAWSARR